tara:strand:+ start:400 stop:702 length:303 start_codon:yes stop_codon:yes gene_type:complete
MKKTTRIRMTEDKELIMWWTKNRPLFLTVILNENEDLPDEDMETYLRDFKYRIETGKDDGFSGGYFVDEDDLRYPEYAGCRAGDLAPSLQEKDLQNRQLK